MFRGKGCFQQVQLTQTVSWTLLEAGTTVVSGSTGCPGSCEESWQKCCVKQLIVWKPVHEMQCAYWQTEAIYGGGICWLVQALLNWTFIAPWLLVASLETVQITASPAKESVGLPLGSGDRSEKGSQWVQLYPEPVKLTLGTALAVLYHHQCKSNQPVRHHWGWRSTSITIKKYSQGWLYTFLCITTALYLPPQIMVREEGERRQRGKQARSHMGKGEKKPARTIFYACN